MATKWTAKQADTGRVGRKAVKRVGRRRDRRFSIVSDDEGEDEGEDDEDEDDGTSGSSESSSDDDVDFVGLTRLRRARAMRAARRLRYGSDEEAIGEEESETPGTDEADAGESHAGESDAGRPGAGKSPAGKSPVKRSPVKKPGRSGKSPAITRGKRPAGKTLAGRSPRRSPGKSPRRSPDGPGDGAGESHNADGSPGGSPAKSSPTDLVPAIPGEENELDDSLVDAVISAEERRLPDLFEVPARDLSTTDLSATDLSTTDLSGRELSTRDLPTQALPAPGELALPGHASALDDLRAEDLGEEVVDGANDSSDYSFDAAALIRTLKDDDDELELGSDPDVGLWGEDAGNATGETAGSAGTTGSAGTAAVTGKNPADAAGDATDRTTDSGDRSNRSADSADSNPTDTFDLLSYGDMLTDKGFDGSSPLYVAQSAVFSDDDDDDDEVFAGADAESATAVGASGADAGAGGARGAGNTGSADASDSDAELLDYFFSSSDSDERERMLEAEEHAREAAAQTDTDDTDEEAAPARRRVRGVGSRRAKEVLASSRGNFRAPMLGTFVVRRKKPFGIIDGYSTRFLHPAGNRLSVLKGAQGGAISAEVALGAGSAGSAASAMRTAGAATRQNSAPAQASSEPSSPKPVPVLDDLINLSEFEDEKPAPGDQDAGAKWDRYFQRRRAPLTAFRNRSLLHTAPTPRSYADATRKYAFQTRAPTMGPGIRRHHHHRAKRVRARTASAGSIGGPGITSAVKSSSPGSLTGSTSAGNLARAGSLAGIGNSASTGNLTSATSQAIPHPDHRKLTTRRRMRRRSIAEAQAEGFRSTKSGLFSEDMLNDVESLLVDIGAGDDCNFLFSAET